MRTLELKLQVTYEPNGVPVDELRAMLRSIVDYAVNNGMMTEDTEAEVEDWKCDVRILPAL